MLTDLVTGAAGALGDRLVGAYVVGSVALGCADAHSDLDVVVVVDGRLPDDVLARLAVLHRDLHERGGWHSRLAVSYADATDLRSPMTVGKRWPHVLDGTGELGESAADNSAHARWLLRERGIALRGPEPRGLVAEVTPQALRAETLGIARERAERWQDDETWLPQRWYQTHAVLTACRILHTADTATVTGKVEAGRWALDHVGAVHHPVIEAALAYRGQPEPPDPSPPSEPGAVAATRALAWDVVRLSGTWALDRRPTDG